MDLYAPGPYAFLKSRGSGYLVTPVSSERPTQGRPLVDSRQVALGARFGIAAITMAGEWAPPSVWVALNTDGALRDSVITQFWDRRPAPGWQWYPSGRLWRAFRHLWSIRTNAWGGMMPPYVVRSLNWRP